VLAGFRDLLFMKNYILHLFLLLFLFNNYFVYSQDSEHQKNSDLESKDDIQVGEHLKKHAIGFMISHTLISTGVKGINNKEQWLALASFGLNYNFNFNKKWALGLHTHMIIEDFAVKESGNNDESFSTFSEEGGDAII